MVIIIIKYVEALLNMQDSIENTSAQYLCIIGWERIHC